MDYALSLEVVSERIVMAATALLVYSHILTLGREIEYIWKEPWRPVAWLYVLIKYLGIIDQLCQAYMTLYIPYACTTITRFASWCFTIATAASFVFQILRTYAVCGRQTLLGLLLVAPCIPCMAIVIMGPIKATCGLTNITQMEFNIEVATELAFESLIVIATIWQTWALAWDRKSISTGSSGGNLAEAIVKNGLLYYVVFFSLTLPELVVNNLAPTPLVLTVYGIAVQFNVSLRWVLLGQFILELRERSGYTSKGSEDVTSNASSFRATAHFVRDTVDADFGEPLYPHRTDTRTDEEFKMEDVAHTQSA